MNKIINIIVEGHNQLISNNGTIHLLTHNGSYDLGHNDIYIKANKENGIILCSSYANIHIRYNVILTIRKNNLVFDSVDDEGVIYASLILASSSSFLLSYVNNTFNIGIKMTSYTKLQDWFVKKALYTETTEKKFNIILPDDLILDKINKYSYSLTNDTMDIVIFFNPYEEENEEDESGDHISELNNLLHNIYINNFSSITRWLVAKIFHI
jgi:hypothetical protein